ncbi:U4/U6-U5 snRNP complex subunit lsm6 [Metarhizium rileyi]|uniref:U6 snRNA-associated Sm-like protein LSm6 n=1 Tax=Metarhizium rileyi (strain RCEF 4871) TaxID=1649241 RepID=A0A5C6GK83_METRR|nr:U4/U6-U5 snRNP complex subunit lsm6 [Metarhizium rileyi]
MSAAENVPISQGEGKDPSSFLSDIIGNPVIVKLNSGLVYKGELQSVDGYMNIALEKTEEYVGGKKRREYGDAFVRGNNGKSFSVLGANSLANQVPSHVHLGRLMSSAHLEYILLTPPHFVTYVPVLTAISMIHQKSVCRSPPTASSPRPPIYVLKP